MADMESHGGGGVYRFSEGSVRRAFDLGRTSDQLHKWLAEHSRTPVPQPLTYLIDDVARRHGVLRIGAASTYLRCDDENVLTRLLSANLPGIRFRRLAPTVVVSPSPPDIVLAGCASGAGAARRDLRRRRARDYGGNRRGEPPRRRTSRDFADSAIDLTEDQIKAVIEKVRAGDRVAAERPAEHTSGDTTAPAETISVLSEAAEATPGPGSRTSTTTARRRTHRRAGPGRRRLAHGVRRGRGPAPHIRPAPDRHRPPGRRPIGLPVPGSWDGVITTLRAMHMRPQEISMNVMTVRSGRRVTARARPRSGCRGPGVGRVERP